MLIAWWGRIMYNSWEGTAREHFGDNLENMTVRVVGTGFPTVYNGQEGGNDKRLEFFEKELSGAMIPWDLYTTLFTLRALAR